ncbi:MAG: phosphoribosylformylglycinamidine synthase subunit PurL [Candidatus Thorarchaeota archaeon]
MITPEELAHVREVLRREPNETELAMLDVLWSEHCSYKSSKRWFHLLNTRGERVFLGPGEGAGLVDIGDGLLVGVHMESHNHPSQVDPYNGAATGVGGIIRDVISQGCEAVGLMNCLRFGMPDRPRNAYILEHVVKGISDYGNSVGIPVVGGEVEFDSSYDENCLVNVVCIGRIRPEFVVRSSARTKGHQIVLFGSTTGRDGMAGASFASGTFSDEEEENRGAVQIGDPLSKKVVIDVLEQMIEERLLDGLQDFGAGGLTACAAEMAFRGGTGVRVDVDKVPLREQGMTATEIMVSESQERMLAAVAPEKLSRVVKILEENDTPYGVVGEVTDDGHYTVVQGGVVKARLPIDLLVNGFPIPERRVGTIERQPDTLDWYREPSDYAESILRMLRSINICDRSWIYSQYDQHVQSNTVMDLGENAGVLEFAPGKMLAFTSDCNSFWCLLDPQTGTANSAAESLRNLVAVGAEPLFIANCLNFGNPERPDSYAQFVEAVKGLGRFSHDFQIPVIGGNVSFYNESTVKGEIHRINPTPQIMMAGLLGDRMPVRRSLCDASGEIVLVGETRPELNGSEYQRLTLGMVRGLPPAYIPEQERAAMNGMLEAHRRGLVSSCNDVGRGGLGVALMKMVLKSRRGFKVDLESIGAGSMSTGQVLFSESAGRYLVEVASEHLDQFREVMARAGAVCHRIGESCDEETADFTDFVVPLSEARYGFFNALREYLE